ncbi:Endonuclease/exonuclease/phosphatase [Talaromyces proteolyticus]|uniref:Endonuclease/exonuclease/phosphatase n=1 Tax=Talaromyces proteolyticus TaxID=1131652 RepID=A0AAD4KWD6_9EURO|nr:Endonuclease/exonuclease/phosphatase [Talaromyces proteolyticus]KAH8702432.1 Endonuclease/exonuclease/phosphatase [Talaromyces proteolyticus]
MEDLHFYILTFNCARNLIHRERFAAHLFDVLPPSKAAPEVLVLNLQEIAPIAYGFLGGSFIDPYVDAFNDAVNAACKIRWPREEVKYVNHVTNNCGLTVLLVFVRSDVADRISWTDTAEVGVGVQEMGNKGAVGARLGYSYSSDETVDFTFVAAHIAPMEDAYHRRNQDWRSIVERLVFTKGSPGRGEIDDRDEDTARLLQEERNSGQSSMYTPRSHLFFAGDLNYRTSDVPPAIKDYARFPQPDAAPEDAAHYSRLLTNDQLTRERRAKRTLYGLSEAAINFPPTYKYSYQAQLAALEDKEPTVWQWSKHRWPSCVQVHGYNALPLFPTSDHRAVALAVTVPLKPIPRPPPSSFDDDVRVNPPFSIDPNWKSRRVSARVKEAVVGGLAYLVLTREGNGFLLAAAIGMFGGWFVLQSLVMGDA